MVEKKKRRFILKVNLILIIVFWLMLPMKVLAEGETPSEVPVVIEPVKDLQVQTTTDPITETAPMPEEIQPNAESTQQPQPEQTSETVLLEGSSIATENPQVQSSEVSDPTDTPESQNNVQLQPTEEPANTGQNNTIMEAVTALEESQAVLVDADGNPIPLATKEAVAALTAPDPQGCPPGVTPTWLGGTGAGCTVNYGSIQAAIDDSMVKDGWTIFIQAGTFIEEIDINKSITLKGSANLSTTIQSPDLLEEDFSTSTKKKSIIYVYGNANVTIDGLVIDGNNKGTNNDSFIGIAFHNAGGQVINNIIENIMDASFSGKQGDVGIFALNDDGVSRSLDVINNVIENFQKNGMALMGNGLTVNVEGNTVVGEGDTSVIAQNGIQVSDGATGKVKDNIIEDIYYTGGDWTASGILIDNTTTGTVEVQGNLRRICFPFLHPFAFLIYLLPGMQAVSAAVQQPGLVNARLNEPINKCSR